MPNLFLYYLKKEYIDHERLEDSKKEYYKMPLQFLRG